MLILAINIPKLVGYTTLALGRSLLILPIPLVLNRLVVSLMGTTEWQTVMWYALLIAGIGAIDIILAGLSRRGIVTVVKDAIYKLRIDLTSRIIKSSRRKWRASEVANIKDVIVSDTERLDIALTTGLGMVLPALCTSTLLLIVLWYFAPVFAAIISAVLIALGIVIIRGKGAVTTLSTIFQRVASTYDDRVNFALKNWELIKTQTAEVYERGVQKKILDQLRSISQSLANKQISFVLTQESVGLILFVSMLLLGGVSVATGMLPLSVVVACYVIINLVRAQLNMVVSNWVNLVSGYSSYDRLSNVTLLLSSLPTARRGSKKIKLKGQLLIDNVSYKIGQKTILNNMSLSVAPRTLTVISGSNGVGKTTLLYIMLGLLSPNSGRVMIDNHNLVELDITNYRRQVGVVSQNAWFLSDTVEANLSYGTSKKSNQSKDNLDIGISMDNHLHELSGGQQQKVALMRALRRNPKILLLDEPTNHLDDAQVGKLISKLVRLKQQITIICVTHDKRLQEVADQHHNI